MRHGVIQSDPQQKRHEYLALMKHYYYNPQEMVWSSWDDSQMKQWLVDHGVVKNNAQVKRDKLEKLLAYVLAFITTTLCLTSQGQ